jgi:hypothetical protein
MPISAGNEVRDALCVPVCGPLRLKGQDGWPVVEFEAAESRTSWLFTTSNHTGSEVDLDLSMSIGRHQALWRVLRCNGQ